VLDRERGEVAESIRLALRGEAGQRALVASRVWPRARARGRRLGLDAARALDAADGPYEAVRWVALRTARMDPRYRELTLDFTLPWKSSATACARPCSSDWLAKGLEARDDQRAAVLVLPDGKLDEARFRSLYSKRDERAVTLRE
jgi:hypothetical protein